MTDPLIPNPLDPDAVTKLFAPADPVTVRVVLTVTVDAAQFAGAPSARRAAVVTAVRAAVLDHVRGWATGQPHVHAVEAGR